MKNDEKELIPNVSQLYDLYSYLFSIPKEKEFNQDVGDENINIKKKRKTSHLTQYSKITEIIGPSTQNTTMSIIKPANLDLKVLLSRKFFHDKIIQYLFIYGNYEKIPHSQQNFLMSIYVELKAILDYIERELVKLRTCYIFKIKLKETTVLEEIIEKFFVPQICACLLYVNQSIHCNFGNVQNSHLVISQIEIVVRLILNNKFNITAAFKESVKCFIKDELKSNQTDTNYNEEFRNIKDDDFPSIARFKKWIRENAKTSDTSIFDKIGAQHLIFLLFTKIKKRMKKHNIHYTFNYLIMDLYYYLNPLDLDLKKKICSTVSEEYYNRLRHSPCARKLQFFDYKENFIKNHIDYCITFAKNKHIKNEKLLLNSSEKIYKEFICLNDNYLPIELLDYLKLGINRLNSYEDIVRTIALLNQYKIFSGGFDIICLFTESLKDFINENIASARQKIEQAYTRIDEYPIGTLFYKYIFIFYIGICQIEKVKPNQFTKKVNYISSYTRFSFMSAIMQAEYNTLNRKKLTSSTYVEDVLIINYMVIFNQFCIKYKLDPCLLFNPFKEIEAFHQIIIYVMNSKVPDMKIKSCNDIIKYIKSIDSNDIFNLFQEVNKNPKVNFTQDDIQDFYESRTFYKPKIDDLGLTQILKSTQQILDLP